MNRKLPGSLAIGVLVCLISFGCIPVEDLGEYWEKGTVDALLEGDWRMAGEEFYIEDGYISFVKQEGGYVLKAVGASPAWGGQIEGQKCRTLVVGKHRFLMFDVREYVERMHRLVSQLGEGPADIPAFPFKGALQRYSADSNTVTFYMVNEELLGEAIEKGQVKGVTPDSNEGRMPAYLGKLDEQILGFLAKIADDPAYWEDEQKLERIEDLQKAIEEATKYPATAETAANTLVDVNVPELKYFAEGRTDVLLRQLQASRGWKVCEEDGQIVCYQRRLEDGQWEDLPGGFNYFRPEVNFENMDSETDWQKAFEEAEKKSCQVRYMFRFSKDGGGTFAEAENGPYFRKAGPTEGKVHLNLRKSREGIASYLAVGQEGLWFELFEQSHNEARVHTREALGWLKEELAAVKEAEAEIKQKGFAEELLPEGSVRRGEPVVEVTEPGFGNGYYRVKAWVNGGEPGYVYLRVFDMDSEKAVQGVRTEGPSKEYIGFSKDAGTLFAFDTEFWIDTSALAKSFTGGVSVFFHPAGGGSDRLLAASKMKVYTDEEKTIDTIRVGRVVDSAGNPVASAQVLLYGMKTGEYTDRQLRIPFENKVLNEASTNTNGIFSITYSIPYREPRTDYDELLVIARKDGYCLGVAPFQYYGEGETIAIALGEGAVICGRVVAADGAAVRNAHVRMLPLDKKWQDFDLTLCLASTDLFACKTDDQGKFAFKHVPTAATAEFIVTADGYGKKFTWPSSETIEHGKYEAGAEDIEIQLTANWSFSGRVVDGDTKAAVGGTAVFVTRRQKEGPIIFWRDSTGTQVPETIEGDNQSVLTAGDGTFVADGLIENEYFVMLDPYNNLDRRWTSDRITVSKEQAVAGEILLNATRPGIVEVTLRKETNEVFGNVGVRIIAADEKAGQVGNGYTALALGYESGVSSLDARADEGGRAVFNLAPGLYKVGGIGSEDYEIVNKEQVVQVRAGDTTAIEVRVRPAPQKEKTDIRKTGVEVTVNGVDGRGLEGVAVRFVGMECGDVYTDRNGKATIPAEYFGQDNSFRYTTYPSLVCQDAARNLGSIEIIRKLTGYVSVALSDGFEIIGKVVDSQGAGIQGAVVTLGMSKSLASSSRPQPIFYSAITDSGGAYRIGGIARGPGYRLNANAEGYGQGNSIFTTDAQSYRSYVWMLSRTNARGGYGFGGNMPVSFDPNQNSFQIEDLVLPSAGLGISGHVVDSMGYRVENVQVTVMAGDGQAEVEPGLTDGQGRFVVNGLRQGRIRVSIIAPEPEYGPRKYGYESVDVEAGERDVVIVMALISKDYAAMTPQLEEGGLVGFLVVDSATGTALEGAVVSIRGSFCNDISVFTNSDGVACAVLPAGNAEVVYASCKGHKRTIFNKALNIRRGQTQQVKLELEPKPRISGTIVDEQGKPVGGAVLFIEPGGMDNSKLTTEADGKFSFTWDAERYLKEAARENSGQYLFITHKRRNLAGTYELRQASIDGWTIVLPDSPMVAGTITYADGEPAAKVSVDYDISGYDWTGPFDHEEIESDARGQYHIAPLPPLPEGYVYRLHTRPQSADRLELNREDLVAGQTTVKDIVLRVAKRR